MEGREDEGECRLRLSRSGECQLTRLPHLLVLDKEKNIKKPAQVRIKDLFYERELSVVVVVRESPLDDLCIDNGNFESSIESSTGPLITSMIVVISCSVGIGMINTVHIVVVDVADLGY